MHAVDDVFVGRAEGGQGAAEAGLAGDHKIIRAQAQVAVGTRDDGRRGRGPDSGLGAPRLHRHGASEVHQLELGDAGRGS